MFYIIYAYPGGALVSRLYTPFHMPNGGRHIIRYILVQGIPNALTCKFMQSYVPNMEAMQVLC